MERRLLFCLFFLICVVLAISCTKETENIFSERIDVFDGIFQNSIIIANGQRSSFSEYVFNYSGDTIEIESKTTIFCPFNQISIFIDHTFYDTILSGTTEAFRTITLPEGMKRISIVEGATSMPSLTLLGTWLTGLKVDKSKYEKYYYVAGDEKIVFLGGSMAVGDRTSIQATEAWTRLFKTENFKDVAVYGWGHASVRSMAGNLTALDSTVDRIDRLLGSAINKKLVIALGTKD